MKRHQCTCSFCGAGFEDTIEGLDICVDCENEFAEFLEERGLVVGEFDCIDHPAYQPDAFKGTKWDRQPTAKNW